MHTHTHRHEEERVILGVIFQKTTRVWHLRTICGNEFSPLCGTRGSNSGHQTWHKGLYPQSHVTYPLCFLKSKKYFVFLLSHLPSSLWSLYTKRCSAHEFPLILPNDMETSVNLHLTPQLSWLRGEGTTRRQISSASSLVRTWTYVDELLSTFVKLKRKQTPISCYPKRRSRKGWQCTEGWTLSSSPDPVSLATAFISGVALPRRRYGFPG